MTFLARLVFAIVFAQGFAQTVASLQVDLSKPLHPVSPMLYGLMTEEINYSYDGGLYAEMVRNRTFQDHGWDGIAHWTLVEKGDSAASIAIDSNEGPSAALQHSLRLDVKRADAANPRGRAECRLLGHGRAAEYDLPRLPVCQDGCASSGRPGCVAGE